MAVVSVVADNCMDSCHRCCMLAAKLCCGGDTSCLRVARTEVQDTKQTELAKQWRCQYDAV